MSSENPFLSELSHADERELSCVIDRFEEAWRQGGEPVIDDFLEGSGFYRPCVLLELIYTDLEYRRNRGEPAQGQDYLERYPELADDPVIAQKLREAGEDTGPKRFANRALAGRFGKFDVQEAVGGGSFGMVYKAFDTELNRLVALKIPHARGLIDQEGIDRFLREARSAAQLHHPGIVAVHDAGRIEGTYYLVSEFIVGVTLTERIKHGPIAARDAADWLAQIAEAVHEAHRQHVIHRDLKPSNIILDAASRPHVVDFGLARDSAGDTMLTVDGQILGTPAYVPPEQAAGHSRHADARSDTYSLGVVLYQTLTGVLPFQGSGHVVLRAILEEEPPSPRRLVPRLPRDLESICLKAMAKEPSARYQTALELADDLRRFLAGLPVLARPVRTAARLWRWGRRRPALALSLFALAVSLVVGIAGITWKWRQAENYLAEAERRQIESERRFRNAHKTVRSFFQLSSQPAMQSPELVEVRRELLEKGIAHYRQFIDEGHQDQASRYTLATAYFHLGYLNSLSTIAQCDQALPALGEARRLWEALAREQPDDSKLRSRLAATIYHLGIVLERLDREPEALAAFQQADPLFRSLAREDPKNVSFRHRMGGCDYHVAQILWRSGNRAAGLMFLERACTEWEAILREVPENRDIAANLLSCYVTLANDAGTERGADAMLRVAKRAERTMRECRPENLLWATWPRELAKSCFKRVEPEYEAGRVETALRLAQEGWTQADKALQNDSTNQACRKIAGQNAYWVGKLLAETGRPDEALRAYEYAAARFAEGVEADPTDAKQRATLGASHHNVGRLHVELGEPGAAFSAYQQAIDLREQLCADFPENPAFQSELEGTQWWMELAREQFPDPLSPSE